MPSTTFEIENFDVLTSDIGVKSIVSNTLSTVDKFISPDLKKGIIMSGSSCMTTDAPATFGFKATSVT